ncbi:hypothetical protein HMPREF0494_0268 [Limosilactobacillus antri DSM 16041]|uniref:Uncharacterized protein n=1 Tax=Limosilactobacillus antri DSM 16041 TaxID=525309 RepID=C8P4M4_9LACO|nr:hypothetical protein HMPREF0494_0268 [Limosilactobacillus antri DSM 16041]KRK53934.1 hypothetical protein FC31_GL001765 [Limosilactobacillus antri DSM 16041]
MMNYSRGARHFERIVPLPAKSGSLSAWQAANQGGNAVKSSLTSMFEARAFLVSGSLI